MHLPFVQGFLIERGQEGSGILRRCGSRMTQEKRRRNFNRARRGAYKDPHLRSSPLEGEGKSAAAGFCAKLLL
jgi:hypothetical protein